MLYLFPSAEGTMPPAFIPIIPPEFLKRPLLKGILLIRASLTIFALAPEEAQPLAVFSNGIPKNVFLLPCDSTEAPRLSGLGPMLKLNSLSIMLPLSPLDVPSKALIIGFPLTSLRTLLPP